MSCGEGHLIRRGWGTFSNLVCYKDTPTLHSSDSYTCPVFQCAAWEVAAVSARHLHPTPMTQGWKNLLPHLALKMITAVFFFSLKAAVHHNFQQVQKKNRILCFLMFKPRNPKGFFTSVLGFFYVVGINSNLRSHS